MFFLNALVCVKYSCFYCVFKSKTTMSRHPPRRGLLEDLMRGGSTTARRDRGDRRAAPAPTSRRDLTAPTTATATTRRYRDDERDRDEERERQRSSRDGIWDTSFERYQPSAMCSSDGCHSLRREVSGGAGAAKLNMPEPRSRGGNANAWWNEFFDKHFDNPHTEGNKLKGGNSSLPRSDGEDDVL